MDLGFETIGNASLIAHDGGPVLVTDPWVTGEAYFGSWVLSHEVPERQLEAMRRAPYVWLSHGHPDHLSPDSLELLGRKPILIGDHRGGRIAEGLRQAGHEVRVLPTGEWVRLSPRLRVLCVPDYSQDSVLLLDFDGRLVVDANDASDRGVGDFLRRTVAGYERSYMLCLTGYGDADMINVFDGSGERVPPEAAARLPVGPGIAEILRHYGLKVFCPSSSMHKYARTDSAWANEFRTEIHEHAAGFDPSAGELLPAFIRYDLLREDYELISPPATPDDLTPPEAFGDDWSEELEPADVERIRAYFARFEHLRTFLGHVAFRVGGRRHTIDVAPERFDRGLLFDVPRGSLMTCIDYEIFDDLLIGNYMRTHLEGSWERTGTLALYPDFTPFVTKYGDNGRAFTAEELREYFRFYAGKGSFGPGPSKETRRTWESIRAYR